MSAKLPSLIVFDLDACLWTPEMFELSAAPTRYDAQRGGVVAGSDTVRLFPGAQAVLRRILTDERFGAVKVGVASSTTEPSYAARCLKSLPIDPSGARGECVADLVDYEEVYPGSKGRSHFPRLHTASGVPYDRMLFFDDCTYGDNVGEVTRNCPGVTGVRTPSGLTVELFDRGLAAWAEGLRGVVST